MVVQGQPQGEEARAALVGHGIAGEHILHRRKGAHQGDIPAARAKHDFPDAVRRQQGGQLKDVFLVCEHVVNLNSLFYNIRLSPPMYCLYIFSGHQIRFV